MKQSIHSRVAAIARSVAVALLLTFGASLAPQAAPHSAAAVVNVSVWPALGTTVTLQDGITTITADGSVITYTGEIASLLAQGKLLTRDPRPGSTSIVGYPTSTINPGAPQTVVNLFSRAGTAQGETIPASYYDTGNVRGGGSFRWDGASTATHNGGTVLGLATVGRWFRVFSGPIDASWFGAIGNDSTDDTDELQAAIDYAASSLNGEIYIPAGGYIVSRTLHMYRNGAYNTLHLYGAARNYQGFTTNQGTFIHCTHSDAPCINISGGHGSVIENVMLLGPAYNYIFTNLLGAAAQTSHSDTNSADWNPTGLASNWDSRYAPAAGIAIDGWAGVAPATHYPTTYVAYGQPVSSITTIRNVLIEGFNVGVVVQPSDVDSNGDYVSLEHVTMLYNKYGVSVGNAQSRTLRLDHCQIVYSYVALTDNTHGKQVGKFGSTISHLDVGEVIHLFQLGSSSNYGPLTFDSLHAEALWRLGDVSHSTSSELSLQFNNSQIAFHSQTDARGIPAKVFGGGTNAAHVKFVGGGFTNFPSVLMFDQDGLEFDGTAMLPSTRQNSTLSTPYLASFNNCLAGGAVFPKMRSEASNRIRFNPYSIAATPTRGNAQMATDGTKIQTNRTYGIPAWIQSAATTTGPAKDVVRLTRDSVAISKTSFSGNVVNLTQGVSTPGYITIVFNALTQATAENNGYAPGDAILDDASGMVFAIRSLDVASRTVVAEAQNNYKLTTQSNPSSAYTTVSTYSNSVGNLYFLNCRLYTPTYPVLASAGAILSGSATYDWPDTADGTGATTTVPVTGALLGDYVDDVSLAVDLQGITTTAWVSSPDNVSVRFQNETGGAPVLASATLRVRVRPRTPSATLTNVGRDDGFSAFLDTDVFADATAGDRVYIDQYADGWVSTANNMVVSQVTGSRTMTLAGAPTRAFENKRIAWFVRAPVASVGTR